MKKFGSILFVVMFIIILFGAYKISRLTIQLEQIKQITAGIDARTISLSQAINNINNLESRFSDTIQKYNEGPKDFIMSPSELAVYLGIDIDDVYNMVKDNTSGIPFISINYEYKFSEKAIDEWMKSRKIINTKK